MKLIILSFSFLLITFFAQAGGVSLSGNVNGGVLKSGPLEGALVKVTLEDKLVAQTITDQDGNYEVSIGREFDDRLDQATITISYVGYNDFTLSDLSAFEDGQRVDDVVLEFSTCTLVADNVPEVVAFEVEPLIGTMPIRTVTSCCGGGTYFRSIPAQVYKAPEGDRQQSLSVGGSYDEW